MPDVELKTVVQDGHVVVTRRSGGDVVLAAPRPQLPRLPTLTGTDDAFCVQANVAGAASRPKRYPWRRLAVSAARPGKAAPSRTRTG